MSYHWRANFSGTVDDLEQLELMLRAVNGFCILVCARGIWIQDGATAGARILPIEEPP